MRTFFIFVAYAEHIMSYMMSNFICNLRKCTYFNRISINVPLYCNSIITTVVNIITSTFLLRFIRVNSISSLELNSCSIATRNSFTFLCLCNHLKKKTCSSLNFEYVCISMNLKNHYDLRINPFLTCLLCGLRNKFNEYHLSIFE